MKEISLKRGMIVNSLGSLTGLGCQWLITIVVVRLANGFDDAGLYSLAMSVYGIFGPLAQYRMYTYQISDVKAENSTGEYMGIRILTSSGALLLCVVYSVLTCPSSFLPIILLYGLFKTTGLVIDVLHACDQAHRRLEYIGISLALQGVGSLVSFAVMMSVFGSLELALLGMVVATLLVGVLFDLPRTSRFDSLRPRFNSQKIKRFLISCFPIVVAGVAVSASTSLPRQYLSYAMGDAALGVYASVAAPVALIQMGVSYIYNPLLGIFAEYYESNNRAAFTKLMGKTAAAMVVVGLGSAVAVSILGEPLLVLFYGTDIEGYAYLLLPMVMLAIGTGWMWFLNDLLVALRVFKATFVTGAFALVVSLLVIIPFVALWGLNGVTFACLLSCIVASVVSLLYLVRHLRAHWV